MKLKKHFDIIIANPPYGKIGAQITKRILEEVDYKQYINLLPANDYKRVQDLWNYVISMTPVKDGFADAAVTTHIADISKNKVNDWTIDEYERSNYIDRQLNKYFEENSKRKHYAIDNVLELHKIQNPDLSKIIFIGCRDVNHGRFPQSKESMANFINLNLGTYEDVCDRFIMKSARAKGEIYFLGNCIKFNTSEEKTNIVSFMYSDTGFKFMSKVFTAMNADGRVSLKKFLPKVDWTREWTVEEILKEYNYTDEEIEEVISDLNNFRGIESE